MSQHTLTDNRTLLEGLLQEVIADQAGAATQGLAAQVRTLAAKRREGDTQADGQLGQLLANMDEKQVRTVARALALWFDLANLAEDRQRVAVLRERERTQHPAPRRESIGEAIALLKQAGWSAAQVGELLARLQIELVLTAHPTEAKRRTVRDNLVRLRHNLLRLQQNDLLPREQEQIVAQMRGELVGLWQTDLIRPNAPTVLDEVARGLRLLDTLWEVVPRIYLDLQEALAKVYPDEKIELMTFLSYASWIGGDRDGHPHVTADVTRETLLLLRQATVHRHLERCRSLHRALSLSDRHGPAGQAVVQRLNEAVNTWPGLEKLIEKVSPYETYRRYLTVIQWRLQETLEAGPRLLDGDTSEACSGYYTHPDELHDDLRLLHESLRDRHAATLAQTVIEPWLLAVKVFGFHGYRLDIRQESRYYARVMEELLGAIFPPELMTPLDEATRCRLITQTLATTPVPPLERLSEQTRETLALFGLLRRATQTLGPQCLGGHVISLTHQVSDVLTVLWLTCWAGLSPMAGGKVKAGASKSLSMTHENMSRLNEPRPSGSGGLVLNDERRTAPSRSRLVDAFALNDQLAALPIVPLFETIDDLKRGPGMLAAMLEHPAYQRHVQALGGRQMVMIGYSDSTKDGGYLAACWNLYEAQRQLLAVAQAHQVELTFFHGRGGSLGRGGGPTARAIQSQPPGSVQHGLRMTEQGEVLADRYDDPQIAHRHLEQVVSATLNAMTHPPAEPEERWAMVMGELANQAYQWYRKLIEHPGFMLYFESATPIQLIPDLQIGSRPSRRHGMKELSDLRAIPWVFSWTQSRQMIPAWFGLGHGAAVFLHREINDGVAVLREMYRGWPFFRATLDNAALALAKTDMSIAQRYAELVEDPVLRESIWGVIRDEYAAARRLVLDILQIEELLGDTPWLKESIAVRGPYIDPLNLLQVELLRRLRQRQKQGADESEMSGLKDLLRITIQGVAAGVRTTG